jgi:hypothetical protein
VATLLRTDTDAYEEMVSSITTAVENALTHHHPRRTGKSGDHHDSADCGLQGGNGPVPEHCAHDPQILHPA